MRTKISTKCPLCTSEAKYLWPVVRVCRCPSCGLMFRFPTLSPEELINIYQTSWENPTNKTEETGATDPELARAYITKLANSLSRNNLKGMHILDFGAGRGAMLSALIAARIDVYAIEPYGFEFLHNRGYKVFRSLGELPKGIKFDGIISLDVIEHVQQPWVDYKDLKNFLSEDGWLYISTPNAAGINAWYFRAKWREFTYRGHYYFFSPRTLEQTLKKSGYKNIKRLKWFINYKRGLINRILHWIFQFLGIDGELRYLAFK